MTESEHPQIDNVGEELQPIAIALQQHHELMKRKFSTVVLLQLLQMFILVLLLL